MGQMAYGLIYGIELPEGLDLHGEGGEVYDPERGLLYRAEKHFEAEIAAYDTEHPFKHWSDARGADLYVPDTNSGDVEDHYVGFWVAVGGSGERGVPHLGNTTLPKAEQKFAKEIAAAKERWERFAAWAKTEGIDLPEAALHLVATEVA